MARYQVICGSIGIVYDGDEMIVAHGLYGDYKRLSGYKHGRSSGEDVFLLDDGDIKFETTEGILQ